MPGNTSVYSQYTIQVEKRDEVAKKLMSKGIPSVVHYPVPLHLQPAYRFTSGSAISFPVAEFLSSRVLSLPMGPDLSYSDQEYVVDELIHATQTESGRD